MFFRSIFNLENILILNKTDFPVYLKKCSSNHCKQCSNKSVNTVQVFLESVFKCERFLHYGMKELGSIVFTALLHLIFKNYLVSIFIVIFFYMGLVQYL